MSGKNTYTCEKITSNNIPSARIHHSMVSIGKYIYIHGGRDDVNGILNDLSIIQLNIDGTISVPIANYTKLGLVKGGGNILINTEGIIYSTLTTYNGDNGIKLNGNFYIIALSGITPRAAAENETTFSNIL